MFYPIYLDLHGRPCLVVGGGPIATGKVRGLVEAGALVTVVAPEVSADVAAWAASRVVTWQALADQANRVANAVDDLDHCNFIAPAVARQGQLQVAISTAGTSPALAKQLRDRVQHEVLTPEAAELAEFLGSWRPEVKRRIDTYERRQALWEGVLEGCVPGLLLSGEHARAADAMH
jgi:siroheme synthase (precorrin-2 oxidase/ferrochelatase)